MKVRWSYIASPIVVIAAIVAWALNTWSSYAGQLEYWVFGLALFSLIPLAQAINDITDYMSPYVGNVTRGLIEATCSNIPEIAIGVFLLINAHESSSLLEINFTIIRGLLIGSVINNVLLVLGGAVTAGAFRNGRMKFDADRAAGFASMLALAVVGLALPTLASSFAEDKSAGNQETASLIVSGILIITYIMYVGASTFGWGERARRSRKAVADSKGEEGAEEEVDEEERKLMEADAEEASQHQRQREEARRRRAANPTAVPIGFVVLGILTIVIFVMAYFFVGVTDEVITQTALTPLSVGLILFPIVCNLGELIAAFRGAWANNMDAAMLVAAGSSVQMPLFVTPVLVFISAILAGASAGNVLTLIFDPVELIVVGLVTFVYALVNLDGETTWLEGIQLLAFYLMIVGVAFVLPGR